MTAPDTVSGGANLELKARLSDLEAARACVAEMGAERQGVERQTDHYFRAPRGRIKLRRSTLDGAHLIVYLRPDRESPRVSRFQRLPVDDADALASTLDEMLGTRSIVEKEREVWWWRDVRIHLDRVTGLGAFVEFEARLDRIGDHAAARARLDELTARIGIATADLIADSYGEM